MDKLLSLYCRGLSLDLNTVDALKARMEHLKGGGGGSGENGAGGLQTDEACLHRLRQLDQSMSEAFLSLADILVKYDIWHRECLLTAFSLAPKHDLFERIESSARQLAGSEKGGVRSEEGQQEEGCCPPWEPSRVRESLEGFETVCSELEASLQEGNFSRGRSRFGKDRREGGVAGDDGGSGAAPATLHGLLSIEGHILTKCREYDPLQEPTAAFEIDGVRGSLVRDLLIVVNSPRCIAFKLRCLPSYYLSDL